MFQKNIKKLMKINILMNSNKMNKVKKYMRMRKNNKVKKKKNIIQIIFKFNRMNSNINQM